jgi:hypothetical protein
MESGIIRRKMLGIRLILGEVKSVRNETKLVVLLLLLGLFLSIVLSRSIISSPSPREEIIPLPTPDRYPLIRTNLTIETKMVQLKGNEDE